MIRHMIPACILLLLCFGSAGFAYDDAYERGARLFRSGDYRAAVPYLENYVSRKPDPAGYYMLGHAFYHLRDYEKSHEYFDQAYLIDPEFSSGKVPAHAGLSRDEEKLMRDALELSGARIQMKYYADILSGILPQVQRQMSKERQVQDLQVLFRSSFSPERLYPAILSSFSPRYDKRHIIAVMQWLTSPPGKKLASVGAAAHAPGGKAYAGTYDVRFGELPDGRKQLILRLEEALSATDGMTDIVAAAVRELLKGMQSELGEGSSIDSWEIEIFAGEVRQSLREILPDYVLRSLSHDCRGLSEEDIDGAIRFYSSPAGRWFLETGMDALRTAICTACREAGKMMGKTLAHGGLAA